MCPLPHHHRCNDSAFLGLHGLIGNLTVTVVILLSGTRRICLVRAALFVIARDVSFGKTQQCLHTRAVGGVKETKTPCESVSALDYNEVVRVDSVEVERHAAVRVGDMDGRHRLLRTS